MESTEIFVPFEPLDQNGLTYSNDTELPEVEFEPDPDCDMALYAQPQASHPAAADHAEGPSVDDVAELCQEFGFHFDSDDSVNLSILRDMITAAITRWPLPALQPPAQPVSLAELHDPDFSGGLTPSQHLDVVHGGADPRVAATPAQVQGVLEERYEFSVVDSDGWVVAGGSAPTLDDAIREARNYLSPYNQDGPRKLELRRVLVLDHSEATHA
jgi:hypothetical protein